MASSFTASQQAGAGQASSANTIVAAWFGGKRFSEGYSREYTWPELAAALAAPHLITPADAAEYKDGPCMVFAKLRQRPTGFCVGRKKTDPLARTALAFDIETNKTTGEVPPAFDQMVERIKTLGWSAALYSSFSHTP